MPSAMISATVIRGLSDAYGSWKIICILRLNFLSSERDLRPCTFSPLNSTSPLVASYKRIIVLPVVDFPQPDSPTRPNVSPRKMSNDRPSTALIVPLLVKKCCFKPLISNNLSVMLFTILRYEYRCTVYIINFTHAALN